MSKRSNSGLARARHCDLDGLVVRLNAICNSATFDLAFSVGKLVIDELYGGDVQAWESDRGSRPSYRALAERADLVISRSALCRAIGVYTLVKRLGCGNQWQHLTPSHLQEVLPLGFDEQHRLLQRAEAESWTVAQLRNEVRAVAPVRLRGARRGLRLVRKLSRDLAESARALRAEIVPQLGGAEIDELRKIVATLRDEIARLDSLLGSHAGPRASG